MAVGRLEFAPDTDEMEVTDISVGRFVFTPRAGERVSIAALTDALEGAGYEIESARLRVVGRMTPDGALRVAESGQQFRLQGEPATELARDAIDRRVRVEGEWRSTDDGDGLLVESWTEIDEDSSAR